MGSICCRRHSRADGHDYDAGELVGVPCPKAPRTDARGCRVVVSPSSGKLVSLPRTDSSELVKLD